MQVENSPARCPGCSEVVQMKDQTQHPHPLLLDAFKVQPRIFHIDGKAHVLRYPVTSSCSMSWHFICPKFQLVPKF